jgi:hypothetical protein
MVFPISASTPRSDMTAWHLMGNSPAPANAGESQPNCMQKIVQWLQSDENPLVLKMAALAVTSFTVIGIGFLTAQVILISSVVAIPTLIWATVEWQNLKSKENVNSKEVELNRQQALEKANSLRLMQEAVGGVDTFNQYPVLDIGSRTGATGHLDFLQPQDLTHPVMRGVDAVGRPFISLKLRSGQSGDHNAESVVTLFQRYRDSGLWVYGAAHGRDVFDNRVIKDAERAEIRQIVVSRDHPHFTLA